MKHPYITVVIPVYGCCDSLKNLYARLVKTIEVITTDFDIIMVNDASPDNSWAIIKELAVKDNRVKGINLSRNFGQHRAITAGIDQVNSDWTVVMDCDLQDQPEEILKLYNKAKEGFDIVFGRRVERQDSFLKKLGSYVFYKIYSYFTESQVDGSVANFSIISKKGIESLQGMREQNRAYPLFVNWIGFNRVNIDIEHGHREQGKSSYTLRKLINLAFDSIISQSNKPLKLSIKFGFVLSFLSMIYGLWLTLMYYAYSVPVAGWTSVMVSLYFIGGLLFANMGILGLYIGKAFDETKQRPLYIIQEKTFSENEGS